MAESCFSPGEAVLSPSIGPYLTALEEKRGSDLHLKVGSPPRIRVAGMLLTLDTAPLNALTIDTIAKELLGAVDWEEYKKKRDLDRGIQVAGYGRYRLSAFFHRGAMGMVLRKVKTEIPTLKSAMLPSALKDIALAKSGLIVVAGPTGSGKSTTLAAMIDSINAERSVHIWTAEDPIEYLHQDKKASVTQREIGIDTKDYETALRYCLRQDTDVIMIGEMRDAESMLAAMQAAEVGHLVMTTVHATDAAGIVPRILDMFGKNLADQVRMQLATVFTAALCQRLIPTDKPESPLVPAVEILIGTPQVKKLIRENKLDKLYAAIETGGEFGMRSLNQALLDLVKIGVVSPEQAMQHSLHPESLQLNFQGIFLDENKRILKTD
jgi:twitching motility protein PilT